MPWRVETVMSQRKEFVALARSEGVIMSELCLRSGISRKTGYKWLRRYLEGGEQRLDDLPKRPHHSPNRTSDDMEQLVVDLRREHPTKGGHVLARILKDRGHNSVPSKCCCSTIMSPTNWSAKMSPHEGFDIESARTDQDPGAQQRSGIPASHRTGCRDYGIEPTPYQASPRGLPQRRSCGIGPREQGPEASQRRP